MNALNDREYPKSLAELVKIGVDAERERCAKLAEALASGVAVEIDGRSYALGIMQQTSGTSQAITALTIAAVIRAGLPS